MGPYHLNESGSNLRTKPLATPFLQKKKVHKDRPFKFSILLGKFPAENSNLTGLWYNGSAGGKSSGFPDLPWRGERNRLLHLTGNFPLQGELENLTQK